MSAPSRPRSVIVIGGGIIGSCVALSLQERQFKVTLVDRNDAVPPPSWGNAGRIAVELSEPLSSLATLRSLPRSLFSSGGPVSLPLAALPTWLPFGLRLMAASRPAQFRRGTAALSGLLARAIPAWRERLSAIGAPELLRESGHYAVWENASSCASGRAAWQRNAGSAVAGDPDPAELKRLSRLITAPIAGALKFTGTASIADPTQLCTRLRDAFQGAGGQLVQGQLSLSEASSRADLVVVAAGVESGRLLAPLGCSVPLIAERGYHLQQADPEWPLDLPPIYFEDRTVVLTRFSSALRMTSFVEFTRKDAPPDERKWRRLRKHARELGLPFDARATEWMGSRPTLPDYLPAIGQSRTQGQVFYAFGHQHLGLTLAAITGELLADVMTGQPASVDMSAFDLDRFG